MKCRQCGQSFDQCVLDLGAHPPSNAYLTEQGLRQPERRYPLRLMVCPHCWLAQVEDATAAEELFGADYAYFSSFSTSWLAHAAACVESAVQRFALGADSLVVEVAANDGYLLQYVAERGVPHYGIEPTAAAAAAARARGIDVVGEFFGAALAARLRAERGGADWIVANNVLAHVPDLNDFVAGFACLVKESGVISFEFQYLPELVGQNQFDTIYHEHFSYLSLLSVEPLLARHGLAAFDVERLSTHGGSLRLWVAPAVVRRGDSPALSALRAEEARAGLAGLDFYRQMGRRAERAAVAVLGFLADAARAGKTTVAYGAAAKGNTLLNFAGVTSLLLPYVVDRNPHKQGQAMPGSRIPIVDESRIRATRPEYVLILPWNLRAEIEQQLAYIREWGGRFVIPIPELVIE
ncbi:class I SAM-dependent methyltransferase [Paludibacterium yongneupense]|uniref:class I SAM-dependent methyltransferase n=1 Tax=Paludibacterium yongneupense TaxID=400061 RepID=UPI000406AFDB|nr:class I SAM-dependent methyltransferase [Paludibacterium yongneupense]